MSLKKRCSFDIVFAAHLSVCVSFLADPLSTRVFSFFGPHPCMPLVVKRKKNKQKSDIIFEFHRDIYAQNVCDVKLPFSFPELSAAI